MFKWHGGFKDGWTESTQYGRKPFMNVRNVLSADEIAYLVYTFSGRKEVHVSNSTGRYIVYGPVTCFKVGKNIACVSHTTECTSIKRKL